MCKEFNRNVLKQIDDIKFPTLESILSPKFTMSSSKFVCEFCNFVGKNQQSKSAHMRGISCIMLHIQGEFCIFGHRFPDTT